MSAFLGQLLIFDLHPRQPSLLEFPHGTHHRERGAEASVRIHQGRDRHGFGNGGGIGDHLRQGQQTDIRQSSRGRQTGA